MKQLKFKFRDSDYKTLSLLANKHTCTKFDQLITFSVKFSLGIGLENIHYQTQKLQIHPPNLSLTLRYWLSFLVLKLQREGGYTLPLFVSRIKDVSIKLYGCFWRPSLYFSTHYQSGVIYYSNLWLVSMVPRCCLKLY